VDGSAAVGARLRKCRNGAGITQEALAHAAKLTPKFVSQIENGHVNPSIGVLSRLVEDGLRIPLSVFFSDGRNSGDAHEDLAKLTALFARQPSGVRRVALRVLEALCHAEDES
jgi:transcriptional regulator with XRE-family HTH domain